MDHQHSTPLRNRPALHQGPNVISFEVKEAKLVLHKAHRVPPSYQCPTVRGPRMSPTMKGSLAYEALSATTANRVRCSTETTLLRCTLRREETQKHIGAYASQETSIVEQRPNGQPSSIIPRTIATTTGHKTATHKHDVTQT